MFFSPSSIAPSSLPAPARLASFPNGRHAPIGFSRSPAGREGFAEARDLECGGLGLDENDRSVPDHAERSNEFFAELVAISRAEAWEIIGGLSRPSKMPCLAWGIPAETCKAGSKLREVPGSVCAGCYALKGYFRRKSVKDAYERRLERFLSVEPALWVRAMVKLVFWQAIECGTPFFRWFDSGDLQSIEMLERIIEVVRKTPQVRHWVPTREYSIVRDGLRRLGLVHGEGAEAMAVLPENLVIRLSGMMVDGPPPAMLGLPTSTVSTGVREGQNGYRCPAREVEPANCRGCRACWDQSVSRASYPRH